MRSPLGQRTLQPALEIARPRTAYTSGTMFDWWLRKASGHEAGLPSACSWGEREPGRYNLTDGADAGAGTEHLHRSTDVTFDRRATCLSPSHFPPNQLAGIVVIAVAPAVLALRGRSLPRISFLIPLPTSLVPLGISPESLKIFSRPSGARLASCFWALRRLWFKRGPRC
jgi:hypothetical protein